MTNTLPAPAIPTTFTKPSRMYRPKFYWATRDTRWDPYPNREPAKVVAHNPEGFWERGPSGHWFKTPTSYNLVREITEDEANAEPLTGWTWDGTKWVCS